MECLNNPQALNNLSKFKVALFQSGKSKGKGTKQRSIHDQPKNIWNLIGLGSSKWELKLSTILIDLHEVTFDFDWEFVIVIPHGIQDLIYLIYK